MTSHLLPDSEFEVRLQRTQWMVREKKLDVLVVRSNEADFANVRYLRATGKNLLGRR